MKLRDDSGQPKENWGTWMKEEDLDKGWVCQWTLYFTHNMFFFFLHKVMPYRPINNHSASLQELKLLLPSTCTTTRPPAAINSNDTHKHTWRCIKQERQSSQLLSQCQPLETQPWKTGRSKIKFNVTGAKWTVTSSFFIPATCFSKL